jgi:hypothetical protein
MGTLEEKPLCAICGKPIQDYPRLKSERADPNPKLAVHYVCPKDTSNGEALYQTGQLLH